MTQNPQNPSRCQVVALTLTCAIVMLIYGLFIDLKGISTDEGIRLAIINGGHSYQAHTPPTATWDQVLKTNYPYAYQPLYFLIQNTAMRVAQSDNIIIPRLVNLFFHGFALSGLIILSKGWRLLPRIFLLGAFALNAYLLMHVLQIREYIVALALYIWSTWLVLKLDHRRINRPWSDAAWFSIYGILLILGFYTQTWFVFPAIGQGLFLVFRRRPEMLRFYAHLGLSYLITISFTINYLLSHRGKSDVGRWGAEGTDLGPQLSNGIHLIFSGHLSGHAPFTTALTLLWPMVMAAAGMIYFRNRRHQVSPLCRPDNENRQCLLMLWSIGVPLLFQIIYFFRVDNLSVWPRYFIIHYFFLIWLLALSFRYLHENSLHANHPRRTRWFLKGTVISLFSIMLISASYQTISYYRSPYFDTGLNRESNWRILSQRLLETLSPKDVVVVHDFINNATLTFTQKFPHRVVILDTLTQQTIEGATRLIYLEAAANQSKRKELAERMASFGYGTMTVQKVPTVNRQASLKLWSFLIFEPHQ